MREIKFRLWCKNKNQWEKDDWIIHSDGTLYFVKGQHWTPVNMDNHVLQQFTGRTYNGIDLYEGDTVLLCDGEEAKVVWHDDDYCFYFKTLGDNYEIYTDIQGAWSYEYVCR